MLRSVGQFHSPSFKLGVVVSPRKILNARNPTKPVPGAGRFVNGGTAGKRADYLDKPTGDIQWKLDSRAVHWPDGARLVNGSINNGQLGMNLNFWIPRVSNELNNVTNSSHV